MLQKYIPRDVSDKYVQKILYSKLEFYKMALENECQIDLGEKINKISNKIFYENYLQNAQIEASGGGGSLPSANKNLDSNKIGKTIDNSDSSFLAKREEFINELFDGRRTAGEIIADAGCKMLLNKHLSYDHNVATLHFEGENRRGDCSAFTATVYKLCANKDIGRHCGLQILDDNGSIWADFSENVNKEPDKDKQFLTGKKNKANIDNLKPGDLLFYGGKNDSGHLSREYGVAHVELYVGNGKILGAGSSGIRRLRSCTMLDVGGLYIGAKRYINPDPVIRRPEEFSSPTSTSFSNGNWRFVGEGGKIGTPQDITIFEALKLAIKNATIVVRGELLSNMFPDVDLGTNWLEKNENSSQKISKYFTMGDLTKGNSTEPSEEVKENLKKLANNVLDVIVDSGADSFNITCAWRNLAFNNRLHSSKKSQHLIGQAADIDTNHGPANLELYKRMVELVHSGRMEVGQLLWENKSSDSTKDQYPGWIHVSIPRSPGTQYGISVGALHNDIKRLVGGSTTNWPDSYHP